MLEQEFITELQILAQNGAENASRALSRFLAREMLIKVASVSTSKIEDIPESLAESDAIVAGIVTRITGEIEGNAALIFKEEDSLTLIRILGGSKKSDLRSGLGELERSMLQETANITISSFMNSIGTHLNKRAVPSVPVFFADLAGAILSVLLLETAEVFDDAVLFSTFFECQHENLKGFFVFFPSPSSLTTLKEGLANG
ncbi:MAG: chemotaxis protein CheC [Desulfobacterales bacterium]|nr:chemotaxis protein CheC [Desulfobacterales bacterium]